MKIAHTTLRPLARPTTAPIPRAHARQLAVLALMALGTAAQAAPPSPTPYLVDVAAGDTSTQGSAITGNVYLDKTGDGLLVMPGSLSNSYTGGTVLEGGLVQIGSATSLSNTGAIQFNGGGLQIAAYNGDLSSRFANGIAGQKYWIDVTAGAAVALTSTALTSVGGTLHKTGDGLLQLNIGASFTGTTTVDAGTFCLCGISPSSPLAGDVVNNATLIFGRTSVANNPYSYAHAISGTGKVVKSNSGILTLSGNNSYTGGTEISGGRLILGSANALGPSGAVKMTGGALQFLAGGLIDISGRLSTDTGQHFAFNTAGQNLSFASAIGGAGNDFVKSGNGTLTLAADNTFTGSTTVTGGVLQIGNGGTSGSVQSTTLAATNGATLAFNRSDSLGYGGTISGAGTLSLIGSGTVTLTGTNTLTGATAVNAGKLVVDGGLGSSHVSVAAGATLGGHGTVGALTLGGWLAPGNSPGTLNAGNTTFQAGSGYVWEINDATGAAGSAWDLLNVTGSLTLAATGASPFTLQLHSLTAANAASQVVNFDGHASHSYTIATASAGIGGFDASAFSIDASAFQNPTYGGTWSVAQNGNNLDLNFTAAAVPEPESYALLLAGLGALALLTRRRQR